MFFLIRVFFLPDSDGAGLLGFQSIYADIYKSILVCISMYLAYLLERGKFTFLILIYIDNSYIINVRNETCSRSNFVVDDAGALANVIYPMFQLQPRPRS